MNNTHALVKLCQDKSRVTVVQPLSGEPTNSVTGYICRPHRLCMVETGTFMVVFYEDQVERIDGTTIYLKGE